jgi:adenine-specific DNA-methyltransferase
MYFTDFENRWLDGILRKIFRIRIQAKRDILLYCLAQACLSKRPFNLFHRANLNLRVNHAGSSFGNKTTWEKQFGEHMLHAYKQLENAWHIRGGAVSVMDPGRLDSRKNNRIEILYLDPPYIRSDRCHESYLLRYHFLEGMVMYPEWGGVIDAGSSIKSLRADLYKDEWRTESDFINGIDGMLNLFNPRCVCVSYAENSKPSVSVIRDILEYHGAKTHVSMKPYKSSLSKNQRSEFFIKGEFK